MRTYSGITILAALVLSLGVKLQASVDFTLETRVYVYRNRDFLTVKIPGATAADNTHGVFFRSPAVAQFDEEKLSLDGASFTWSGSRNPPDRFSLIATPVVPLTAGKHLTFLSTAPIQYLEKRPDGALQVRELPSDSPEAPHCRMTFAIEPAGDPSKNLRLACDLDIATVSARKNLSGVTLDVGKPVLASLKEKVEPTVRPGEWSALLLDAPNRSDYSLLMLLKIAPGHMRLAATGTPQENGFKTAAELDRFVTNYYRHPQLELIGRAIEALGPSGLLRDRRWIFVGFFAEVFAANPNRADEWRRLSRVDWYTKDCLQTALKLTPEAILSSEGPWWARRLAFLSFIDPLSSVDNMCWGAFYASGNPAYLRKLVRQLRDIDLANGDKTKLVLSLASAMREHPLVRTTLEAARAGADPRTRKLIDDLLEKDLAAIQQEIWEMNPSHDYGLEMTGVPGANGIPGTGERFSDPGPTGSAGGQPPFHN